MWECGLCGERVHAKGLAIHDARYKHIARCHKGGEIGGVGMLGSGTRSKAAGGAPFQDALLPCRRFPSSSCAKPGGGISMRDMLIWPGWTCLRA
eukprot:5665448-Alexandrium_andersonii.AAC.1